MKRMAVWIYLCSIAPLASASVAILGQSSQNITFASLGSNFGGEGQSSVTWGSCAFSGTTTKCNVSGSYTGIGQGGTYSLLLTYPGNGPTPLQATSISPGNDLVTLQFVSSGSLVITLTPANGTAVTFYNNNTVNFTFSNPTCTGVTICAVGQEGVTAGSTISGPVTGSFDATPFIRSNAGVITAGGYGGFSSIAPGTWMEIYGTNLATTLGQTWTGSDFNGTLAPTALGGTTVTVGGKPAFIDYVSNGQVNAQVPSGVASGPQPVVVTTAGGVSAAYTVTVKPLMPGLLSPSSFTLPAGQYVTALFKDGVTFVLPPGAIRGLASARAKPGDIITLYGVGFGPVTPDDAAGQIEQTTNTVQASFQASFGNIPATVNYDGLAPTYVGLYQFNVVVPNVAASDSVPFTFSLGGTSGSQTLLIAIQN